MIRAYVAVLDADVLHPHISVDDLLRLAERRLFRPAWSVAILGEVRESLIRRELDAARVDRRLQTMHEAFPFEVAIRRLALGLLRARG